MRELLGVIRQGLQSGISRLGSFACSSEGGRNDHAEGTEIEETGDIIAAEDDSVVVSMFPGAFRLISDRST